MGAVRTLMIIAGLTIAAGLCGCPPQTSADRDAASADPPGTCTKLGATCTVSPGKLGTCVEVEQTAGPSAFVCQSQH
jgi:hypothetical protein